MTSAYGIDFGTSNSSIGVCDRSGPRLIPIQQGATSVPTALFFNFDDDVTVYGQEALDQYFAREPGRYLRAIKSVLGTRLFDEKTQVKTKRYDFGEIIASFLRFLRTTAAEGMMYFRLLSCSAGRHSSWMTTMMMTEWQNNS